MAKFCGEIGYGESVETPSGSGVYVDVIKEVTYFGEVIRNTRALNFGESVTADITVGNSISIIADQFAFENFFSIRYIIWNKVTWVVSNVEVRSPRLILSLGAVYNGPRTSPIPNDISG